MEFISTEEVVILKMTFAQFIYLLIAMVSIFIYLTNVKNSDTNLHLISSVKPLT